MLSLRADKIGSSVIYLKCCVAKVKKASAVSALSIGYHRQPTVYTYILYNSQILTYTSFSGIVRGLHKEMTLFK